jgi:phenylacetate-CoA ligase
VIQGPAREALLRGYRALPSPLRSAARSAYRSIPFPYSRGLTFGRLHHAFWRSQHWSSARLDELQLRELRRVAAHAYRTCPVYRERFDAAGLEPRDIRSLADWSTLPLTTKPEVQDAPEAFTSSAVPRSKLLSRSTSGSTGTPLVIHSTSHTHVAEAAIMYRGWRWSGYRPGDRVATIVGELTGVQDGPAHAPYTRYREGIDLSPHHLTERGCRSYLELLRDFEPAFLRTYPSIVQVLGKEMKDMGMAPPPLRGIWTQSEVLYPGERELLEEQWGCRVFDYYGMQEKCVAMSECEHGRLHIHSEFGFVELVPSERPPFAHIVATGFFNRAMPLIRYQTRDLAVPDESPCPCGRQLPTVSRIVGRLEDFLIASDGTQVMEADSAIADLTSIRECQIVQESLSHTRVLVVPGRGYDERAERTLRSRLQPMLGLDVRLDIERCPSIPRTGTGKQRFIVSKVNPGWRL